MHLRAALMLAMAATLAACTEPAPPEPASAETVPTETAPAQTAPADAMLAPAPVAGLRLSSAGDKYPPGALTMRKVDTCNIESVAGSAYFGTDPVIVSRSTTIVVNGWLFDPAHVALATGPALVIEKNDLSQRWEAAGVTPVARQDVVDANALAPDLLDSGFTAELDISTLEPGEYHLFLAYGAGSDHVICDNARTMVLQ